MIVHCHQNRFVSIIFGSFKKAKAEELSLTPHSGNVAKSANTSSSISANTTAIYISC